LDYKQIISSIKKGEYAPMYCLYGEESYFIDQIINAVETSILTEAERSFNQIVLYGKDIDFKAVADNARQFPMMAERRVVVVREAQDLKSIEKLESYFSQPSPHTVLAFAYKGKKPDKRKKAWKAFAKNGVLFESKRIYDNQLPAWIDNYLKTTGKKIDYQAAILMAEYLGTSLSKVTNELDKLVLNLGDQDTITVDMIQEQIGISKDFNVFELQSAIGYKKSAKAYRIIKYFAENDKKNPLQMTIPSLCNYFTKVLMTQYNMNANDFDLMRKAGIPNKFFVKDYKAAARNYSPIKVKQIIGYLHEADLRSKGVGIRTKDDLGIYQELIHKIFAA